jgi:hypothetical protein
MANVLENVGEKTIEHLDYVLGQNVADDPVARDLERDGVMPSALRRLWRRLRKVQRPAAIAAILLPLKCNQVHVNPVKKAHFECVRRPA